MPDTAERNKDVIRRLLAEVEGDRVAARISARGTHTGELFGQAPTGRVVTLTGGLGILDQLGHPAAAREAS